MPSPFQVSSLFTKIVSPENDQKGTIWNNEKEEDLQQKRGKHIIIICQQNCNIKKNKHEKFTASHKIVIPFSRWFSFTEIFSEKNDQRRVL